LIKDGAIVVAQRYWHRVRREPRDALQVSRRAPHTGFGWRLWGGRLMRSMQNT